MNPIYIVFIMAFFLVGCEAEVTQNITNNFSSPGTTETASPEPSLTLAANPEPSASQSPTNTGCWNSHVKKNGAAWASYPTASRAAGNTWYACYGKDSNGNSFGVWLAFYEDNTIYLGVHGGLVLPDPGVNNDDCSNFEWKNDDTLHGYATDATLDSDGTLLSIDLTWWWDENTEVPNSHLTCSEVF
jgi:hypothetical protein